jgi:hypothetical protein
MNTITKIADKNYSITKEMIDAMLIDNTSELSELLVGLFTLPEGTTATTFIVLGAIIDGTAVTNGFAIHEGVLTRIVGGEFTGYFAHVETPTIVEGVDDYNNPYKTEIINKVLIPSSSGIDYADMVRINFAMREKYQLPVVVNAHVRYEVSESNCYKTQFNRGNLDLIFIKNSAQGSYPFTAGWNTLGAIQGGVTPEHIQISSALVTFGTTTRLLPVKVEGVVISIYYPEVFTADDIIITVRMNYDLT